MQRHSTVLFHTVLEDWKKAQRPQEKSGQFISNHHVSIEHPESFCCYTVAVSKMRLMRLFYGSLSHPHYAARRQSPSVRVASCCISSTTTKNPYSVLGIPVHSDYSRVKQAFLKAAMRYHPDLSKNATTGDFVRIRQAFEQIVNNDDKDNDDTDDNSPANWMEDVDLEPYFRHRTNEFLTFDMDDQTRKEVIQVYETMSRGGNDKGGYWEMARQLAEREAVRGDAEKPHVRLLSTGTSAQLNRRPRKR
jgi:hypothetical protein